MEKNKLSGVGIDAVQRMVKDQDNVIRLESGDTNLTPMPHVIHATREAIGRVEYNSYVPFHGLTVLREAIAERIHLDNGIDYDPEEEIVVTAGGTEGMLDALLATVELGDEVIMPEPVYAGMVNRVKLAGATPVYVPLKPEEGWRLDVDRLKGCVTSKTKALFFVSPNSPTGTVYNKAELQAMADTARDNNLHVIYNAVFDKIIFDGGKQLNIASFPGMKERTLVIGSVSKNYGMTGWRVGWVAGPANLMSIVNQVHISNAALASPAGQVGAVAALQGPQDWVRQRAAIFQQRQEALLKALAPAVPLIKPIPAEGGWSFIADVRKLTPSSYDFAAYLLREARVAVTPMKECGSGTGEGFVRFVFSKNEISELEEAGRRVVEAVRREHG